MPKRRERPVLNEEERKMLEKWSQSRKGERRLVERSQMVLWAAAGMSGPQIGQRLDRAVDTVYRVLNRFEKERLAGLRDEQRSGRPPIYSEEERGRIVAAARTKPGQVGRVFGNWTLDRLVEYINKEVGIAISRAQLARLLQAEGLRWYQEKVYFSERPDPQFAEKRGR
jgi:transposase